MAKDIEYGIPSQKKFPLDSEAHVRSAIRFFNYADPSQEKQLASAIIRKMKEYGIDDVTLSKDNRFYNYYNPHSIEHMDFYDEYIAHHGILGMKWGVRRYQNADGSLTAAGAQRYGGSAGGGSRSGGSGKKHASMITKHKRRKAAKKARETRAANKARQDYKNYVIRRGSASEAYAIKDQLTNEEKRAVLERIDWDNKLAQASINNITADQKKRGKSKTEKIISGIDTAGKVAKSGSSIVKFISDAKKLSEGSYDDDDKKKN